MNITHKLLLDIIASKSTFAYADQIIHLFTGGSSQHGGRIANTGDLDICGIYLESLNQLTSMRSERGFVGGTGDQHTRNTSADEDYTFKTLREWAILASKGNPTMLGYLFTNTTINDPAFANSVWFKVIVANSQLFASKAAGNSFLGYGTSQLQRMQGIRGSGKHGQRDKLTIKFGFDVKAAMHMIRMMHEGLEFMQTGAITYPRPERNLLISIRQGLISQSDIIQMYMDLESDLKQAISKSSLPEKTNNDAINKLLLQAHEQGWNQQF